MSLDCHLIIEGVAMHDWKKSDFNDNDNEVEILTKVLLFGKKRCRFVRKALTHTHVSL